MKALRLKLKYDEIVELDKWLSLILQPEHWTESNDSEKSVCALLTTWHIGKLKPKTFYYTREKLSFKLEAPLAFSFAYVIKEFPLNQLDYLGNSLRRIVGEIDQHFQ